MDGTQQACTEFPLVGCHLLATSCLPVVRVSQGCTGKALTNIISVGIGGSYLGPEFVYEAIRKGTRSLRTAIELAFPATVLCTADAAGSAASAGRTLRFLANVDPVDVARAVEGLDPETTLVRFFFATLTIALSTFRGPFGLGVLSNAR